MIAYCTLLLRLLLLLLLSCVQRTDEHEVKKEAICKLLLAMREDGIQPDLDTYRAVLSMCGSAK
jgi:Pentatricopeptide repeat domain